MSGWAYILVRADRSFYVGSTSYADVDVRVQEHNAGKFRGYTAARRPVTLVWSKRFDDLVEAQETERRLKGWSHAKKRALLAGDEVALFSLSSRRGGKPKTQHANLTKREIAVLAQSAGAKSEATWASPRRPSIVPRTGGSDVSAIKLATSRRPEMTGTAPHISRHPEVRAKRAPKDE